ncbi:MAG: hypothetical protein A4E35_02240 [Methanoregula sp. PtaU1.Bin051]|nr:MAG: hypothetical protein A4E35_02240 [Methanoregula sp. PtaU1.Bin051]
MKKLFVILMILALGILASGCTSQPAAPATPAQTAAPTEAPTTAPTEAPTTAPTETPTAEVTTEAPTETATPIPDFKIKIANTLTFEPAVITIPAGTKVIFYTDAVGYKFKVGIKGLGVNVASDIITPTQTWSYTFTKAGTYTMEEMIYTQFRDDHTKITVT